METKKMLLLVLATVLSLHLKVPGCLIFLKFDMNLEDNKSLYKFFWSETV